MKAPGNENGFNLSLMPGRLDQPLKRKKTCCTHLESGRTPFGDFEPVKKPDPGGN